MPRPHGPECRAYPHHPTDTRGPRLDRSVVLAIVGLGAAEIFAFAFVVWAIWSGS